MRYFTNNPMERLMMQVPRTQPHTPAAPTRNHPCFGCKRYGESCALLCYRGVVKKRMEYGSARAEFNSVLAPLYKK